MKEIKLTKGQSALVDDEDYEELSKHNWYAHVSRHSVYACRHVGDKVNGKGHLVRMHRQIMGDPVEFVIDHINHNGLDNRKENLRICTLSQNSQNCIKTKPTKYLYKGIRFRGKKAVARPYSAQLTCGNKNYYLGIYATIIEAARAYDAKAIELFGEFACLNFPEEL